MKDLPQYLQLKAFIPSEPCLGFIISLQREVTPLRPTSSMRQLPSSLRSPCNKYDLSSALLTAPILDNIMHESHITYTHVTVTSLRKQHDQQCDQSWENTAQHVEQQLSSPAPTHLALGITRHGRVSRAQHYMAMLTGPLAMSPCLFITWTIMFPLRLARCGQ